MPVIPDAGQLLLLYPYGLIPGDGEWSIAERAAGQLGGTLDELPLRIRQSNVKPGCFLFRYRLLR